MKTSARKHIDHANLEKESGNVAIPMGIPVELGRFCRKFKPNWFEAVAVSSALTTTYLCAFDQVAPHNPQTGASLLRISN